MTATHNHLPTLAQWSASVESEPASPDLSAWLVSPFCLPLHSTGWDRVVWDAQLSVVDSVGGWERGEARELLIGGVCVLLVRPGSRSAAVVRVE